MKHWVLASWLAGTASWFLACGSAAEDAGAMSISALEVDALPENGGILVDLRDAEAPVRFDHGFGPIDYRRIGLVCPDGNAMPLDVWLMLQGQRLGTASGILEEQLFSLSNAVSGAPEESADGPCLDCYRCTDGALVCRWLCGDDDSSSESVCPTGEAGCRGARDWIGALAGDDGAHPDWDGDGDAEDDSDRPSLFSGGRGDGDGSGDGGGGGG
ncbi:MAG: hypothetical protein HYY06_32385, partial [Deltaproteobacteria bacterium]|nr:hypothetical protein [Deltaproteobacteria bacterium]